MMPNLSLLVSPRVVLLTADSAFYTFGNFFTINIDTVFLSLGLHPIQNYSKESSLIYITPIDNAVAFMRTLVSEAGISGKDK